MRNRVLALLALFALLLALVPATTAQDDPGCFGLSAEDCELIDSASANTLTVSSFQQDFSIDFSLTGLAMIAGMAPEAGIAGDITFTLTGSGPFVVAPDSPDGIAFQAAMDVVINNGPEETSGPLVVTLVDGVLYLEFNDQVFGIEQESAEGAAGLDLSGGEGASTLAEFFEIDPMSMGIAGASMGMPPSFEGLVTYARADNTYTFNADVGAILATDDIAMLLPMLLSGVDVEGLGLGLTTEDLAELLPQLTEALAAQIGVVQRVDPEANLVTGLDFTALIDFDLGAAVGSPGMMPPIIADLTFSVDVSNVNGEFEIVAPEGAEMIDPEDIDFGAMLGGGM